MSGNSPDPITRVGTAARNFVNRIGEGDLAGAHGGLHQLTGELADPLGIDPIGRFAHEQTANFWNPNYGGGFNEQVAKAGEPAPATPPPDPTDPPNPANSRMSAFEDAKRALRKRRLSSTLLTGGTGVLDSATTSSTTLMGV